MSFDLNVSRETKAHIEDYVAEVLTWNKRINLISPADINVIYERHIYDSLQVARSICQANLKLWVDLGSGGGFPGIVVAICSKFSLNYKVRLVESDKRKAVFLSEVIRKLDLPATVIPQRIEKVPPQSADVISARALAPLSDLLRYSSVHLKKDGFSVFPKGKNHLNEIEKANVLWKFDVDTLPSAIDSQSVLLKIQNIKKR